MTASTVHLDLRQDVALRRIDAYLQGERQRRQLHGTPGRMERVVEWGGSAFCYAYDHNGDLTAIQEANGRRRRYAYDTYRRLHTVEHGAGRTTRYVYDDRDRLAAIDDQGLVTRYAYDGNGRISQIRRGEDSVSIFRYDSAGRVTQARTAQVDTRWQYDANGRTALIEQSIGGVTLRVRFAHDEDGRISAVTLPGDARAIHYMWDGRGRPHTVAHGERTLAKFAYSDDDRTTSVTLGNGVQETATADLIDGRPVRQVVRRDGKELLARTLHYAENGALVSDGERCYTYDPLGRLVGERSAREAAGNSFQYDAMGNLTARTRPQGQWLACCTADGRLETIHTNGEESRYHYDDWGRLVERSGHPDTWHYRYDAAGHLREVRRNQVPVAAFLYDHKGRLVWSEIDGVVERYLYGDGDELLAVTDGSGLPRRLLVRTPYGVLAEIEGAPRADSVIYHHNDERGSARLLTDAAGQVVARFAYDPFGLPVAGMAEGTHSARFCGRQWYAAVGLYYFGARWYDPAAGRFLTPDSYTGAPDDARLLNPLHRASMQATLRSQILGEWLKQPRVRNGYAFCHNDPIGRVDPNGHWSFGGVLLTLLGAIWTLPNTIFGILVEITCLIGEVIRWLVWLFSGGNVTWMTPGFDTAASGNLNAFALVFSGGWLGSFQNLLGVTFGNVFFVYKEWRRSKHFDTWPDPVFPPAYNGKISIPRERTLYEHELRHTNQYGWLGPFFHLGLPVFGFYQWDVIFNGYEQAWTERDARAHGEPDECI